MTKKQRVIAAVIMTGLGIEMTQVCAFDSTPTSFFLWEKKKKLSTQGLTHLKWINLYIINDDLLSYYNYCASLCHALSLRKNSGGKIETLLEVMCFPGGIQHLISTDSE